MATLLSHTLNIDNSSGLVKWFALFQGQVFGPIQSSEVNRRINLIAFEGSHCALSVVSAGVVLLNDLTISWLLGTDAKTAAC